MAPLVAGGESQCQDSNGLRGGSGNKATGDQQDRAPSRRLDTFASSAARGKPVLPLTRALRGQGPGNPLPTRRSSYLHIVWHPGLPLLEKAFVLVPTLMVV